MTTMSNPGGGGDGPNKAPKSPAPGRAAAAPKSPAPGRAATAATPAPGRAAAATTPAPGRAATATTQAAGQNRPTTAKSPQGQKEDKPNKTHPVPASSKPGSGGPGAPPASAPTPGAGGDGSGVNSVLALAQKGEWGQLEQLIRTYEKGTPEVLVAEEVSTGYYSLMYRIGNF